jgi:HK97 family phage prohead protease
MSSVSRNSEPFRLSTKRIEVRSKPVLRGNKLGGYAAVFGEAADLGDQGKERMAVGSLDRALKTSDARSLYNHSPLYVLGRQKAGTLRLLADDHGLEYEIDLPNTTYAADLRELVERGDIDGASFAFVPDVFTYDRLLDITTHTDVEKLIDVSPVTYPAYEGATVETRSCPAYVDLRRRSQIIRARARVRHMEGAK